MHASGEDVSSVVQIILIAFSRQFNDVCGSDTVNFISQLIQKMVAHEKHSRH